MRGTQTLILLLFILKKGINMKFCKDCKHHKSGGIFDWCKRNLRKEVNSVTGKTHEVGIRDCSDERYGNCGKEAIYFEGTQFYKLKQKVKGLFVEEWNDRFIN